MKVVTIEAYENAYRMGYDRFYQGDTVSQIDSDRLEFHMFTGSAMWANSIAPKLRAMAGFSDSKGGTYQVMDSVAYVEDKGDIPMDAQETDSRYIYDDLVDMYQNGAYDAFHENECDVTQYL